MGLAASQARFLCITARKANCEYKTTQLAQDKYEISQQLSDISYEYSNAMNATKLVWDNDSLENVYDLTYSLLMMASDANDYNPYFVTTPSGAIVLNSNFAAAAKAAGISKGGAVPSQTSRNKFIEILGAEGIMTNSTAKIVQQTAWNKAAGMGAAPIDKNSVTIATLPDLITKGSIGGQTIDWMSVVLEQENTSTNRVSYEQYRNQVTLNNADIQTQRTKAEQNNINITIPFEKLELNNKTYYKGNIVPYNDISDAYIEAINNDINTYDTRESNPSDWTSSTSYELFGQYIEVLNYVETNPAKRSQDLANKQAAHKKLNDNKEANPLFWAMLKAHMYEIDNKDNRKEWGKELQVSDKFRINAADESNDKINIAYNGNFCYNSSKILDMSIGDLMSDDIVIMVKSNNEGSTAAEKIADYGQTILEQVASVLGYGRPDTALNVDSAANEALEYAYYMTQRQFLNARNTEQRYNMWDSTNPSGNGAWECAEKYNRIGVSYNANWTESWAALNLSNMVSAFLTFFDQSLRGSASVNDGYNVGRGIDSTEDSKTYFVTDNPYYSYILETTEVLTNEQKVADFYDQLYNNLCHYGWRQDDSVDHTDYLESAIKDGRFSLMSLNYDGYYYQTRYNSTGYMKEVQDDDAITRAEIEYTRKKAELTAKEDSIDIKTKNLDAEIAELTSELESVKQLVSKNIEKTFAMYQQ